MTDCPYTYKIFYEDCTEVTSSDVSALKELYTDLDHEIFGLRMTGDQATIFVWEKQLARFPIICRHVRKHLSRFPGN
jgi:hypothetical protein